MSLHQIIETLSQLQSTQGEILRTAYRTEGKVEALGERVNRIEDREHGRRQVSPQQWMPRDYMAAGAGIVMVLAAVSEKVGWTTVIAALSKMYIAK